MTDIMQSLEVFLNVAIACRLMANRTSSYGVLHSHRILKQDKMSVINNRLAMLSNKCSKQKIMFYFYCQKQLGCKQVSLKSAVQWFKICPNSLIFIIHFNLSFGIFKLARQVRLYLKTTPIVMAKINHVQKSRRKSWRVMKKLCAMNFSK